MITPESGHQLGSGVGHRYLLRMLQAGLFPEFKGANTLLLWGDAPGIAELRDALAGLSRGATSTITISELLISVSTDDKQPSALFRAHDRLSWVCPPALLVDAEGLVAGLDEVQSGHQFIDVSGLADRVIVSKNEYPQTLQP